MFKRFFLVSSALLFGVLSVSSLLTANASATPIDDLSIKTTTSLHIAGGSSSVPEIDITSNLDGYILQSKDSLASTCSTVDSLPCNIDDAISSFDAARSNPNSSYTVTQDLTNYSGGGDSVIITWWDNSLQLMPEVTWSSGFVQIPKTPTGVIVLFNQPYNSYGVTSDVVFGKYPATGQTTIGFYAGGSNYVLLYASKNINANYPQDYTGQSLSGLLPSVLPDFSLPASFTVQDKKIWVTLAPFAYPDKMPPDNYAWRYSVFIKKDNDVLFERTFLRFPETVSVEYTINGDYGEYTLIVRPENFGPPAVNVSDFYTLVPTTIPLDINGSTYIVNPDDLVCDAAGLCTKPSVYADCNQFNTEITILGSDPFFIPSADSFVCIFNNFGTFLRVTSISFFVPRQSYLSAISTNSNEWFLGQFGMVKQSFDYTYQFASSQLSVTPNCTLSVPSVTFFGAPVNWNFCTFENEAPNVYNVAINFARAVLATMMLLALAYRLTHLIDEFRS